MTDEGWSDELVTGELTRDWGRFDVSAVPPQGAYVAKRCPVRAQNDVLQPAEPLPPDPVQRRRFQAGNRFEAIVTGLLTRGAGIDPAMSHAEREAATVAAMAEGADVIYGGQLPMDTVGRRVGKPDLLVREDRYGSDAAAWSYRPIDVKHHATLRRSKSGGAHCSSMRRPHLAAAETLPGEEPKPNRDDLLQLAHYQRMLEACGWAPARGRWGGIVGKEQLVGWRDLDEPLWRTPAATAKTRMRTTMEVYDFEFAFRLDVMAAAALHLDDPSVDLLVVPIRVQDFQQGHHLDTYELVHAVGPHHHQRAAPRVGMGRA